MTAGSFFDVLNESGKYFAEFLARELPNDKRCASLKDMDIAELLSFFKENWSNLQNKHAVVSDKYCYLLELQNIRNAVSHQNTSGLPEDDIIRYLDTLLRFCRSINVDEDFCKKIERQKQIHLGLIEVVDRRKCLLDLMDQSSLSEICKKGLSDIVNTHFSENADYRNITSDKAAHLNIRLSHAMNSFRLYHPFVCDEREYTRVTGLITSSFSQLTAQCYHPEIAPKKGVLTRFREWLI